MWYYGRRKVEGKEGRGQAQSNCHRVRLLFPHALGLYLVLSIPCGHHALIGCEKRVALAVAVVSRVCRAELALRATLALPQCHKGPTEWNARTCHIKEQLE
ncbi:hypothetical protein B296_00047963 [Ensete ventricosum]|uniref:Uncharacterized protein n=1 Tax=Ensete ventricosum TaxID=4639 RepID=A0A426YPL0_ENSVE|nr:hypothetical protein B296_00047963 [Ensete ventricosum]